MLEMLLAEMAPDRVEKRNDGRVNAADRSERSRGGGRSHRATRLPRYRTTRAEAVGRPHAAGGSARGASGDGILLRRGVTKAGVSDTRADLLCWPAVGSEVEMVKQAGQVDAPGWAAVRC
jgi:hypothetical protein